MAAQGPVPRPVPAPNPRTCRCKTWCAYRGISAGKYSQCGRQDCDWRVNMASGLDLVLCAIDADSGQVRFGPRLSYALPVAELADLAGGGRVAVRADGLILLDATPTGEPRADDALSALSDKWPPPAWPFTVLWWARWRGPRRIDPYLSAAVAAGVVDVTSGVLTVLDPGPVRAAASRLVTALELPAPSPGDIAFVVLADAARLARPHLKGRSHRKHRARLRELRRQALGKNGERLLRDGCKAIATLASLAMSDGQSIDEKIGLSQSARRAAVWFRL